MTTAPRIRRVRPAYDEWDVTARTPWPVARDQHHVIVVGAGIGGLSAGALLAKQGHKVLVVEAHHRPGGYCSCWDRRVELPAGSGLFRFDAGVQDFSGLGERGPLRSLLRRLNIESRVDWLPVRHFYWHEGIGFDVPADPRELAVRLGALFPQESAALAEFFAEIGAVYRELYADVETTGGVPRPPAHPTAMLAWPAAHPHAWRWMKQPFDAMLDHFFHDPALKHLLTTLSEYITDRPGLLSVADMAPLYGYYFDGGSYPRGGSQRLADVLVEVIEEHGGRVALSSRVKRILVDQGAVAGIETANGKIHRAPVVVAGGDVVTTLVDMVGPDHLPNDYFEAVRQLRRGPSAVMVSLGLDILPDLPARVFVRQSGIMLGIGNPSRVDAGLAPAGHAALTLLCLLPEEDCGGWQRRNSAYGARKTEFAERLVTLAETSVLPGLRAHIVHQEVASPPSFTLFAKARNGAVYGAERRQWLPGPKSPLRGLLLVGAGTATGAGIEAVVISGIIAAEQVATTGKPDHPEALRP